MKKNILFVLALAVGFVACKDESTDPGGENNENNKTPEQTYMEMMAGNYNKCSYVIYDDGHGFVSQSQNFRAQVIISDSASGRMDVYANDTTLYFWNITNIKKHSEDIITFTIQNQRGFHEGKVMDIKGEEHRKLPTEDLNVEGYFNIESKRIYTAISVSENGTIENYVEHSFDDLVQE